MLLTGPFAMLSLPSFDFHLPPCTNTPDTDILISTRFYKFLATTMEEKLVELSYSTKLS